MKPAGTAKVAWLWKERKKEGKRAAGWTLRGFSAACAMTTARAMPRPLWAAVTGSPHRGAGKKQRLLGARAVGARPWVQHRAPLPPRGRRGEGSLEPLCRHQSQGGSPTGLGPSQSCSRVKFQHVNPGPQRFGHCSCPPSGGAETLRAVGRRPRGLSSSPPALGGDVPRLQWVLLQPVPKWFQEETVSHCEAKGPVTCRSGQMTTECLQSAPLPPPSACVCTTLLGSLPVCLCL